MIKKIIKKVTPLSIKKSYRKIHKFLNRTSIQRKIIRFKEKADRQHKKFGLEYLDQKIIKEVQAKAEEIYGTNWNYYSDALRPEVVYGFEKVVNYLKSTFDKIDYLEIGSAQGLSMGVIGYMLAKKNLLGELFSIDPYFKDGYYEGYKSGMRRKDKLVIINKITRSDAFKLYDKLDLQVRLIEKTSNQGLIDLIKQDKKFNLIYIDGSHEGLNPLIDFGLSYCLLPNKGIIIIDDYLWPDVKPIKLLCDKYNAKIYENWKIAVYQKVIN